VATTKKFTILQGETWQRVIRWEGSPFIYKPITGISAAAPVSITAVAHGLVSGWRAAVVSVLGMTEINAVHTPPRDSDYHQVTVVDANTVTMNDVNSAGYSAYASGGYLQFYTPVSLAGFTANMDIKDKIGGTILTSLTTVNGGIVLNAGTNTITLLMSAAATELITWANAVYDLDLISASGVVTPLYTGTIQFVKE
jgi:hypothetical protein